MLHNDRPLCVSSPLCVQGPHTRTLTLATEMDTRCAIGAFFISRESVVRHLGSRWVRGPVKEAGPGLGQWQPECRGGDGWIGLSWAGQLWRDEGERQGREGCLPARERAIYKEALPPSTWPHRLGSCLPRALVNSPGEDPGEDPGEEVRPSRRPAALRSAGGTEALAKLTRGGRQPPASLQPRSPRHGPVGCLHLIYSCVQSSVGAAALRERVCVYL